MKPEKLQNPFPVTGYHGPDYFCDRENELSRLTENIISGNSTTLMSLRRMGKTGLIHHLLNHLPRGWKGIYVDILPTEDMSQLLNMLSTSIVRAIPEKTSAGQRFWNLIKKMRPIVSFNSLTGEPQITFDLQQGESQANIDHIFRFLDSQNFNTVIALDEFQQIVNYPEKNSDAWLRSIIQQLQKVVFIFSGSQQHLMSELFVSPARPFFRSTQIMTLDKINRESYIQFIVSHFKKSKKKITSEVAGEIADWCNFHTYYVQLLCNRVFSATSETADSKLWKLQAEEILNEQEPVFYNYRNLLTPFQWHLLKAIAAEEKINSPTGKMFVSKYTLGSSASVLRALSALIKYELIYKHTDKEGNTYYAVYDILFKQWVREGAR